MDTPQRRRPWLHLLAALTLLGLLLYPATRWIVRQQFAMELLRGAPRDPLPALHQAANRHPNDFALQWADATTRGVAAIPNAESDKPDYSPVARELNGVAARFPDQPAIYAALIRYDVSGDLYRPEGDLLSGKAPQPEDKRRNTISSEQLQAVVQAAEQGEKLDPDNAYFPFMRAWGLFAMQRDSEALDAVLRAGAKSRWEDYATEEVRARWRLEREAFGERGAWSKFVILSETPYPHDAKIRQAARIVAYKAVEAEQAGRTEEGFALRHALMHTGSLMRVQSRTMIGSLVGIAITAIGASRPGGAPAIKRPPNDNTPVEQRAKEQREKYAAYLHSIGKEGEARWAQAELESGWHARSLGIKAMLSWPIAENGSWLGIAWIVGMLALSSLLMMLIIAGAATLAARVRPKRRLPLTRLLLVSALVIGLFYWQVYAFQATENLGGRATSADDMESLPYFLAYLTFTVPFLTISTLESISKRCKVPTATGVGRGLRRLAVPIACVLTLLYGGIVLATAQKEARFDALLQSSVRHEGRFLAATIGQEWPGPVAEPQEAKLP